MIKSWFERLQNLFLAVTFAESGDTETARKYLEQQQKTPPQKPSRDAVLASRTRRLPAH